MSAKAVDSSDERVNVADVNVSPGQGTGARIAKVVGGAYLLDPRADLNWNLLAMALPPSPLEPCCCTAAATAPATIQLRTAAAKQYSSTLSRPQNDRTVSTGATGSCCNLCLSMCIRHLLVCHTLFPFRCHEQYGITI